MINHFFNLNGFSTFDGLISPSKPRIFKTLQVIMLSEVVDHLGFSSLAYKSSTLVFRMAVDSMLDASGTSTITLDETSGPLCPRATSEDGR